MRNRLYINLVLLFLFAIASNILNAQTVYITEKGKKYHKKNCSIVKEGKKGLELSEAKRTGYGPCKSCFPETNITPNKQEATEPKKKKE